MNDLNSTGFGPFFQKQINTNNTDNTPIARIAAEHRGGYHIWTPDGPRFARLAGRLMHVLDSTGFPGVGDWVTLRSVPQAADIAIIESILNRTTLFTRGNAGRNASSQVIAANVDVVFVVCGLDNDFNVRRIERYLARIWASGARPMIVLNKSDRCNDVYACVRQVELASPGVDVTVTSALHDEGLETVQANISHGITAAFVGSSGAGKSTLINALLGDARMACGPQTPPR